MLNVVVLIGRLGTDPEIRYTTSGDAITRLSLATNFRFVGENGQIQEITDWHKVVCWGKLAETAAQHLSKGRLVAIVGRIYTRKWQDQNGDARYTTEIKANRVIFLNGKNSEDQATPQNNTNNANNSDPFEDDIDIDPDSEDEDVPF